MLKITLFALVLWGTYACLGEPPNKSIPTALLPQSAAPIVTTVDSIPKGLQRLMDAYPQQNWQVKDQQLIWADGFALPYQDGRTWSNFEDSLGQPTLALQLAQPYPKGEDYAIPSRNQDPGRIRVNAFFEQMYGATKAAVQANLVTVDFLGTPVRVTKINAVHLHLAAVVNALKKHPEWQVYCLPVAGTFNWRKIAGTERWSSHSFGIAIDLNVKKANYWRWAVSPKEASGTRTILYKNQLPLGLVALFEAEGFIWGGKWYHYDTMHFEYRPELL